MSRSFDPARVRQYHPLSFPSRSATWPSNDYETKSGKKNKEDLPPQVSLNRSPIPCPANNRPSSPCHPHDPLLHPTSLRIFLIGTPACPPAPPVFGIVFAFKVLLPLPLPLALTFALVLSFCSGMMTGVGNPAIQPTEMNPSSPLANTSASQ